MQIHEEAQRKAEAEAAAVLQERQRAAEEAAHMAAAARQRALTVHQVQAQQEAEARKKYALHLSLLRMFLAVSTACLSNHCVIPECIHGLQQLTTLLHSTSPLLQCLLLLLLPATTILR